jgi:hypothetical protein
MKFTHPLFIDRIAANMVRPSKKLRWLSAKRLFCLALAVQVTSAAHAKQPSRPDFDKVSQAVLAYFQSEPDQQRGDLISQREVKAALAQVAAIGWDVPGEEKVVDRALADNSFIICEFSTPDGRKFMRKLAQQPGTFSRLDRLSSLGNGEATIHSLIHDKKGDDFITYLATTSSGKSLGKMMAGTKGGVDLNKPTGRIYTADELIDALKQVYDATR